MKRRWSKALLFSLLWCGTSQADLAVYDIDGKLKGAFPGKPALEAEIDHRAGRTTTYSYTDEQAFLVFTGTYGAGADVSGDRSVKESLLRDYVDGQALAVGGMVTSYQRQTVDTNPAATFSLRYTYDGYAVRKFGIVAHKGSTYLQWAVQDVPALSTGNAKTTFNLYVRYFSVE